MQPYDDDNKGPYLKAKTRLGAIARTTANCASSGFITDQMVSGKIQTTLYRTTAPVTLR